MKVYVVTQDDCFRGSFLKQEEAEAYIVKRALGSPHTRWGIDIYEVASDTPPEAPVFASPELRLVR